MLGLSLGTLPEGGGSSASVSDFCLLLSPSAPNRDEFNIQVLHAFVELHEFTDLNLVQALR